MVDKAFEQEMQRIMAAEPAVAALFAVENDILNFDDMVDNLLSMGYENRAPSADALREDGAVVARERCAGCAGPLQLVCYTRRSPRSYRAFAWCVACGTAHEF